MRRLIAAAGAATLVSGLLVVATSGTMTQAGGRSDVGPIPLPDRVCLQWTSTPDQVVHYLCVNYPTLPSF